MCRLTAVHLAANHTLCVLNRDLSLGVGNENDKYDDCQRDDNNQCSYKVAYAAVADHLDQSGNHRRTSGDDAGKQQDADAVAHTVLGDQLTHVHDEGSACGKGQNDDASMPEVGLGNEIVASEQDVVGIALEKTQRNTQVTGDG